jgi:hypothetical protein
MRSRFYVEFPSDPIVNVHWKAGDKDGGGEPPPNPTHITCGAWVKSMYDANPALPGNAEGANPLNKGFGYWVLYPGGVVETGDPLHPFTYYDGGLYGHGVDFTTGHDPNKPASYFPLLDPPQYLWTNPVGGWTVTYHYTLGGSTPVHVGVWRGFSLHYLAKNYRMIPPTELGAGGLVDVSMDIIPDPVRDNGFPIIFGLVAGDIGGLFTHSVPEIVQAHCCKDAQSGAPVPPPCIDETTGAPPPPPYNEQDGPQPPPYFYEFSDPAFPYPVP